MGDYIIFNSLDDQKKNLSKIFGQFSMDRDPLTVDQINTYLNRKKHMQEYDFTIRLDTNSVINFVDIASRADGDVDVWNIGRQRIVDGKSLIGVMALDLNQPIQVKIRTDNPDEYMQFCDEVKKFSI
ncbi:MAG: HPr family phosphocarrier protein [Lachnospiraceae bacterium]|nr:HPr family phosphocarrier protein [Lachnospiraceae bacterium]MBQ6482745.1 HPr family phosphocarrier protein [Anaerolineaceae bacterium]